MLNKENKKTKSENDYAFWRCSYSPAIIIQKFHFLSKNGILKIKFDSYQIHIKYQTIEDRKIYVRIMFRLKKMFRDVYDYCKTLWDRFKQLINCDNDISRCARGALFKYKCYEKAMRGACDSLRNPYVKSFQTINKLR